MADGANAAYPGGNARHFVKGTPFGELLESTHLGNMELGAGNTTLIIQMNGNLCVAFNPAHRIDRNSLHWTLPIRTLPSDSLRVCAPPAGH